MLLERRVIPGLAIYSYIVGDEKSKRAAVIDPVRDVAEYMEIAKGFKITDIIETHVHADFVSGALELKHATGGNATIHCSGMGGQKWTPIYADHVVKDGDQVVLGNEVVLEAFHTPGHTPEHLTWKLYDLERSSKDPWILFTGDFLFVGDVGRPDLLGEEARKKLAHELYQSIFSRLQPYPDFVEIFPAHGAGSMCGKALGSQPNSTLGYERELNRSLKKLPEQEWISQLMHQMPKAPPYFPRMKQINIHGPRVFGGQLPGHAALSAQKVFQHQEAGALVLDVRSKEAFAAAHIPGSINIPQNPMLSTYAGWLLDPEQQLIIVSGGPVKETVIGLFRVGFDAIAGYLDEGIAAWEKQGFSLEHLDAISTEELKKRLDRDETVLDVRTEGEWLSGHIEGAIHHQLGPITDALLEQLDPAEPINVICGGGTRSAIMASCLQREGCKRVSNVLGGMSGWKASSLPII